MKIIITGTPGCGKTTIAKKLSKKTGIELYDCKKLIEKIKAFKLDKNNEMEVLMPKFRNALKKELRKRKSWIIESHLLCEIKLDSDFIFILRCNKKTLEKRLIKRKYAAKKINDNLMVELLDYCYLKSRKNLRGKLFEVDTSQKSVLRCIKDIISAISGKRKSIDETDYSKELINFVVR
ncbi:MAG: AAA family ATPase [Candidatus Micrarchaeia archaeon]